VKSIFWENLQSPVQELDSEFIKGNGLWIGIASDTTVGSALNLVLSDKTEKLDS
jgi:hypothetical protein